MTFTITLVITTGGLVGPCVFVGGTGVNVAVGTGVLVGVAVGVGELLGTLQQTCTWPLPSF